MFKKITFLIAFSVCLSTVSAQKTVIQNNPNYKYQSGNETTTQTVIKRTNPIFQPYWSFGGNVGMSFWNGGTDILIAPKAYYHLTPQFITGFGVAYNYSDYDSRSYNYKFNSYGGSILGIYRPIPYLQFSAEFQELFTNRSYNTINGGIDDDYWNSQLYLGASFVSGHFAFGFQYDVLYDEYKSPYSSAWTPVISFYF
jgi:hypothetical protein